MTQPAPGHDWIAIVRKHGTAEFGKAFAAHPTLDASVLGGPCAGLAAIAAFFAATSGGMYETLEFTHEATSGRKTYLEWQGTAFGKQVRGTTILTRNHEGLIDISSSTIAPCRWSWSLLVNWQSVWRRKVDQAVLNEER